MPAVSAQAAYNALIAAGFTPAAAVTMTQIGEAESHLNTTAVGDVALETNTWGPSVGAFQERTLKAATGTGKLRDIANITGDLNAQAADAYTISDQGSNFAPWTTYTDGAYKGYAATVANALGGAAPATDATGAPVATPAALTGGGVLGALGITGLLDEIKLLVLQGIFGLLGLGLIGAGVIGLSGTHPLRAAAKVARP